MPYYRQVCIGLQTYNNYEFMCSLQLLQPHANKVMYNMGARCQSLGQSDVVLFEKFPDLVIARCMHATIAIGILYSLCKEISPYTYILFVCVSVWCF